VTLPSLPIDDHIESIRSALADHRAAVLVAPPGSGKTTRVPPALVHAGRAIVLQPRRMAARAVARRIADEQGWTLGQHVGWHVRFERKFTADTGLLIVTEGMLTAYLDDDPLLAGTATVVLDEFHERSLHTDVGLALVKEAWKARDDLRVLVMSATFSPAPVSAFLGHCPIVRVPGLPHPLSIEYAPGETMAQALAEVLPATTGDVLGFLPGAGEIERALRESAPVASQYDVELVPLHGSLDADAQDRALRPSSRRRVVLATNIAETSLTVPGVSIVIDSGLQKVTRYDADRAIDSLVLERVTEDSADQRAGRAARLGPGLVRRLWDRRDRLRPEREPEIRRVDLAGTLLGILAAGNTLSSFDWFEAPEPARVDAALDLLRRLEALEDGRITPLGHQMRRLPLQPRLSRVLLVGRGSFEAAAACALLSEPGVRSTASVATWCDLLPLIDRWSAMPFHVRQVADHLQRLARSVSDDRRAHIDELELCRALLAGYPDRVASRRAGDRRRVLLASGRGGVMGRESAVNDGDWLVALDLTTGSDAASEAIVRMAARIEPEWIVPTSKALEHRFDRTQGTVKAVEVERYGLLVLSEHPVAPDPQVRTRLMSEAWLAREPDVAVTALLNRARFAGVSLDLPALAEAAAASAKTVASIDILSALSWTTRQALDAGAPETFTVPSGRSARLEYADDGSVMAAVKLQELFGLAETPRIGSRREPVTFQLLAPNGRPVQTTRDLKSFWARTYPEVRKELRGRYPRHPWPEDPWRATPTHQTTRRSRRS
jgi:ATP-dependent helicase HrpB